MIPASVLIAFGVLHYSAATDAWGTPTLLDSGGQSAYEPKVDMDGNGNAVVVWMQQLGIEFNASAAHYRVGSGWEAAVLLENENSAVNPGFQQSSVAMDNAGNAIAVWAQRIGVESEIRIASKKEEMKEKEHKR